MKEFFKNIHIAEKIDAYIVARLKELLTDIIEAELSQVWLRNILEYLERAEIQSDVYNFRYRGNHPKPPHVQ